MISRAAISLSLSPPLPLSLLPLSLPPSLSLPLAPPHPPPPLSPSPPPPQTTYSKLKEEGNSLFVHGDYKQALGKYLQALKFCREHKMRSEMSLIRANCAQAILKLELFSDAYTPCCECVKLDRTNHKEAGGRRI